MPVLVVRKSKVLPGRICAHRRLDWTSEFVFRHSAEDFFRRVMARLRVTSRIADGDQRFQFCSTRLVLRLKFVAAQTATPLRWRPFGSRFVVLTMDWFVHMAARLSCVFRTTGREDRETTAGRRRALRQKPASLFPGIPNALARRSTAFAFRLVFIGHES